MCLTEKESAVLDQRIYGWIHNTVLDPEELKITT